MAASHTIQARYGRNPAGTSDPRRGRAGQRHTAPTPSATIGMAVMTSAAVVNGVVLAAPTEYATPMTTSVGSNHRDRSRPVVDAGLTPGRSAGAAPPGRVATRRCRPPN